MAYSVRITGYSEASKRPTLELEPVWWDPDMLSKDPRFHASQDLGCTDYDADFSVDDARQIHEHFRPAATTGIYDYEPWQKRIQPMLEELDSAFGERSAEFRRFHICVFEWESGL